MAIPPNDAFANATLITGDSGFIIGTNISASVEVGEPLPSFSSVWYVWPGPTFPPPDVDSLTTYFATTYLSASGNITNSLRSNLQVFSSGSLSTLTELTYIQPSWPIGYANWYEGSRVVFNSYIQTLPLFIRVDSIVTGSKAQGNFSLNWGTYNVLSQGSCTSCPPVNGLGYSCVGSATILDVTAATDQVASFGIQPAGFYIGQYCKGALVFRSSEPAWSTNVNPAIGNNGPWYGFNYIDITGSGAHATMSYVAAYNTQVEAEVASSCTSCSFVHGGGEIALTFHDDPTFDNINGKPNPVYGLYRIVPVITEGITCASWITTGVKATATFQVINKNPFGWPATASLQSGGGISSPSAPIQTILAPDSITNFTYTWNASTLQTNAEIIITGPDFAAPIPLTWYLGPVIQASYATGGNTVNGPTNSPCTQSYQMRLQVANMGYSSPSPLTMSLSCTNGVLITPPSSCAPSSSFTILGVHGGGFGNPTLQGCDPTFSGFSLNSAFFTFVNPLHALNSIVSATFTDTNGINYGTIEVPMTI